jgi:hypothetical protein
MKAQLLFLLLFFIGDAISQNANSFLNHNKAAGFVGNRGILFSDLSIGGPGYAPINPNSIPFSMLPQTIYGNSIVGISRALDSLRGFRSQYNGGDIFTGPVASDYTNATYQTRFGNGIWEVSVTDIQYHLDNFQQANYVMDFDIENWPAHGDTTNGEAFYLAPFVDANGDGIYNPDLGDYPEIRGESAIYAIMNDDKEDHVTGLEKLKLEIHQMVYQSWGSESVSGTTFVHFKVFNRSPEIIPDFQFGMYVDFDLGNYIDDYIGTNPGQNLFYGYNGDNFDEPNGSGPGFGTNLPAMGIVSLNEDLHATSFGGYSNLNSTFSNQMNGATQNGTYVVLPDGDTLRFIYSGTTESVDTEVSVQNPSGDRRMYASIKHKSIAPNQAACYDFAYIFAQVESPQSVFEPVLKLFAVADTIQAYYDNQNFDCLTDVLSVFELPKLNAVAVFPNPFTSSFTLQIPDLTNFATVSIFTTDGKLVQQFTTSESKSNVSFEGDAGLYYYQIELNGNQYAGKLIKN